MFFFKFFEILFQIFWVITFTFFRKKFFLKIFFFSNYGPPQNLKKNLEKFWQNFKKKFFQKFSKIFKNFQKFF